MRVARVGFTPLKGGRHLTHGSVELSATGPVGDRAFCLIDPATDRCLRTVERPTLLQARAEWDGTVLSVELPTGTVVGEPEPTNDIRTADYWGRAAMLRVMDGPWAAAFSAHLGREVLLASAAPGREVLLASAAPGAVVYGASVSLVTSASLARLADEVGGHVDGARFRATFQLDGDELTPHAEDEWVGRRLRLGAAEIEVRSIIPRCAVVDLGPDSGVPDLALLKALARCRRDQQLGFGVDAMVTVAGRVSTGDPARLLTV